MCRDETVHLHISGNNIYSIVDFGSWDIDIQRESERERDK